MSCTCSVAVLRRPHNPSEDRASLSKAPPSPPGHPRIQQVDLWVSSCRVANSVEVLNQLYELEALCGKKFRADKFAKQQEL